MECLDTFIDASELTVTERWEGVYPTQPDKLYFIDSPARRLHVALCFGTGMTLSFGVAEMATSRALEAVPA